MCVLCFSRCSERRPTDAPRGASDCGSAAPVYNLKNLLYSLEAAAGHGPHAAVCVPGALQRLPSRCLRGMLASAVLCPLPRKSACFGAVGKALAWHKALHMYFTQFWRALPAQLCLCRCPGSICTLCWGS